jgi:Sec20
MAEELEVASGNLSLISASEHKLQASSAEYARQHGILAFAQRLLRIIHWQDRQEDVLLYSGIVFFACCVLYVVLRRSLHFVPALALPTLPRWRGAAGRSGGCEAREAGCSMEL